MHAQPPLSAFSSKSYLYVYVDQQINWNHTFSEMILMAVADPVGFDEVRSNPPFLVRWRPFTTSLAVLFSPLWLNIGQISIRYSLRIARYLLVSVDQVRFCGELLFFSSSFFFSFFFFFLIFFFFPSLSLSPGMGSVPGRANFLPITLFFSSLLSPLFYTSFFPSFFVLL